MHCARTFDDIADLIDPTVRWVEFPDEPAIIAVSTAWRMLPPADEDVSESAVTNAIRASASAEHKQRAQVEETDDEVEIHTARRDAGYVQWNHVFWDVAGFLENMNGTGVHFHPPKHDVFGVAYPKVKEGGDGPEKVWETDVLLIPVFLGEGVKVRMDRVVVNGEGREKKTLGTFDGANTMEIWFVKFGTKVELVVEGTYEDGKKGTAAVMAVGILCRGRHDDS